MHRTLDALCAIYHPLFAAGLQFIDHCCVVVLPPVSESPPPPCTPFHTQLAVHPVPTTSFETHRANNNSTHPRLVRLTLLDPNRKRSSPFKCNSCTTICQCLFVPKANNLLSHLQIWILDNAQLYPIPTPLRRAIRRIQTARNA